MITCLTAGFLIFLIMLCVGFIGQAVYLMIETNQRKPKAGYRMAAVFRGRYGAGEMHVSRKPENPIVERAAGSPPAAGYWGDAGV